MRYTILILATCILTLGIALATQTKDGVTIDDSWGFDGVSAGSCDGVTVESSSDLVLFYEYNDGLTNVSGYVVDSSAAGNNGTPGLGGALPTWSTATNGMTNIVTYDGGDSITSEVTEAHATIMFWATSGSVWRSYIKTGAGEYINGVTQAFDETYFYSTSGDTIVWGDGFTGDATLQRVWSTAQTTNEGLHWAQAPRVGYSQWDADNRSDWSNTVFVGTFSYDKPADTSPVGNHGTKGAGGAAPTHTGDADNGYYDFDGGDYITTDANIGISGGDNRTITYWARTTNDATAMFGVGWGVNAPGNMSSTYYRNGEDKIQFVLGAGNRIWDFDYSDGAWHHYAFVVAGTNATDLVAYVDGEAVSISSTLTQVVDTVDAPMIIGKSNIADDSYWIGEIDEVRIYNLALASNAVNTIYTSTTNLYYP